MSYVSVIVYICVHTCFSLFELYQMNGVTRSVYAFLLAWVCLTQVGLPIGKFYFKTFMLLLCYSELL